MKTKELMGVHTPKETTQLHKELTILNFDVTDISYSNDETDSISFEGKATIYLPKKDHFTTFSYLPWDITFMDEDGTETVEEYDYNNEKLFDSSDDLIKFLLEDRILTERGVDRYVLACEAENQRKNNIEYLQNDYGLKELWNDDEFKKIPWLTNDELNELVTERKDFYNEQ